MQQFLLLLREYLQLGIPIVAYNAYVLMVDGATFIQALRADALLLHIPFRPHWIFIIPYLILLWPVTLIYLIGRVFRLIPHKSWQELIEEW